MHLAEHLRTLKFGNSSLKVTHAPHINIYVHMPMMIDASMLLSISTTLLGLGNPVLELCFGHL